MPLIPVVGIDKPDKIDGKEQLPVYPDHPDCFCVGKNGVYRQVNNRFYRVRYPVEKVAGLAELTNEVAIKVNKLPLLMFQQVESFFALINDKLKGEAVVILAWSTERRKWAVKIPPQETKGMSVRYAEGQGAMVMMYEDDQGEMQHVTIEAGQEVPEQVRGFENFGTIHSHCDATAFHSGTDDKDEYDFDGLHITIGHLAHVKRDYSVRWIFMKKQYVASIEQVVAFPVDVAVANAWTKQVQERTEVVVVTPQQATTIPTFPLLMNSPQGHGNGYQNSVANQYIDPHQRQYDFRQARDEKLPTPEQFARMREEYEWGQMRGGYQGNLKPEDPGYILERALEIPAHVMTTLENRLVDALETDHWLREDLEDNTLCRIVIEDEDAFDKLIAAGVDESGEEPPTGTNAETWFKAKRKKVIEEIKENVGIRA